MKGMLRKIDGFAYKYNKYFGVLSILLVLAALVTLVLSISEYINVAILHNIEGYPWNCHCLPEMENYASPEAYSKSMVGSSVEMVLFSCFAIYSIIKRRSLYVFLLGLVVYVMNISLF